MITCDKDNGVLVLGNAEELMVEFCLITERMTLGLLKGGAPKDELLKLISDATIRATTNGVKEFAKEQSKAESEE